MISEGSGFAFSLDGQVITAAHVVTGRLPLRESDFRDPLARIFVAFPSLDVVEMRPSAWGPTIVVPQFKEPVDIDLAVLHPLQPLALESWLPASLRTPRLGSEVFLAGYPDDLRTPFDIERRLSSQTAGAAAFLAAMQRGYIADMTGPMLKRAVVGNHGRIFATANDLTLAVDVFNVDAVMHSGASGGPMFDSDGNAVGVIVERAMTSASQKEAPNLAVPSGSTVAISLHPLEILRTLLERGRTE